MPLEVGELQKRWWATGRGMIPLTGEIDGDPVDHQVWIEFHPDAAAWRFVLRPTASGDTVLNSVVILDPESFGPRHLRRMVEVARAWILGRCPAIDPAGVASRCAVALRVEGDMRRAWVSVRVSRNRSRHISIVFPEVEERDPCVLARELAVTLVLARYRE